MSNDLSIDTSEMNVLFVHSAIDDFPLSAEEFRVYAHIARRAGLGEAWPAMASIAAKCHLNEGTARKCIHALTAYRLLSVEDRSMQGKSNRYRLTPRSAWMTHEEVVFIQTGKTELERAKRKSKAVARAEAIARGETPPQKSVKKPKKGGVLNGGRGSEEQSTPPKRGEASETEGGGGIRNGGRGGSETEGGEVYPLRGSLEVAPTAVVNLTELNAQPGTPAPSVAVAPPPEVTTTEDASLQKDLDAQTLDGPSGAGTPDGVTDEVPELTDEEAEFLFGGQDENATDLKQVPPGGAAVAAELLAQAESEHDPEATRAVLTPNLGGQKKLNALMEETPPGLAMVGKTRRAWITDITPERAEVLVTEARTNKVAHPWTAITELLDREVGAKIQRGSSKAAVMPGSNGNASKVTAPGQKLTTPPVEPATGSTMVGIWESKANPGSQIQVIAMRDVEVNGKMQMRATLADGTLMSTADLVVKHRQLQVGL